MRKLHAAALTAAEIDVLLGEALRLELKRILADQDRTENRGDAEIDTRIDEIEEEIALLKRAGRRNDFTPVADWTREAALSVGFELEGDLDNGLGRRTLKLRRDIAELERQTEDGEDAAQLAAPLVAQVSSATVAEFVSEPVLCSTACEKARELYPNKSMQTLFDTAIKLLTEFLGDIPVAMLTADRQRDLFGFMARLPKNHGKSHGKNRFTSVGRDLTKRNEIEDAERHAKQDLSGNVGNGRDGITNRLALTAGSRMATTRSFPSP